MSNIDQDSFLLRYNQTMNIIEEVQKLDLPLGTYVVFGSGILGALGIREAHDIDLLVTRDVFQELRRRGWEYSESVIEGRVRGRLSQGLAEAFEEFWYGGEDKNIMEIIARATIIEGIPFMSLSELRAFKSVLGREVDRADIARIDAYIGQSGGV